MAIDLARVFTCLCGDTPIYNEVPRHIHISSHTQRTRDPQIATHGIARRIHKGGRCRRLGLVQSIGYRLRVKPGIQVFVGIRGDVTVRIHR